MSKQYEKQLLVEAETKLEALQFRLDVCYPDLPAKSLVMEFYDRLDHVNNLRAELIKLGVL